MLTVGVAVEGVSVAAGDAGVGMGVALDPHAAMKTRTATAIASTLIRLLICTFAVTDFT